MGGHRRRYEVLAIRASRTRSGPDAYMLIRKALKACMNRPLFLVDKGPWYPYALNRLGLEVEACHLRHEEQDREVVSHAEEEDEGLLQQRQPEKGWA